MRDGFRGVSSAILEASLLAASSAIVEASMVQNKRRRKFVLTVNSYLEELNQRVSDSLIEFELHTAAPGSSDAYLDELNAQQQESWGCKRPTEDSACGESVKRVARGPQVYLKGLNLQGHLGSGTYGCVFECTWQTRSLAVKIYHDDGQAGHDAKRELMLLKHLDLSHRSAFVCHLQAWEKKGGQYLWLFERFHCNLRSFFVDSQRRRTPIGARQAMIITYN